MAQLSQARYFVYFAFVSVLLSGIFYESMATSALPDAALVIVLVVWLFVIFRTTDRLAINYVSYPTSRAGRFLTFFLFALMAMFTALFLFNFYDSLTASGLAALLVLTSFVGGFRTTKVCGYRILYPIAFVGAVGFGSLLLDFLIPQGGFAFGILGISALIIAGGVILRFRERRYPSYFITGLYVFMTALGLWLLMGFYPIWPYDFFFLEAVVAGFFFAHSNKLRGALDFRGAFNGSVMRFILAVAALLFILGIFVIFVPSFAQDVSQALSFQTGIGEFLLLKGIMPDFAVLGLGFVGFAILSMIGTKWSVPLAFVTFAAFSTFGLLTLVQSDIPGVWSPAPALSLSTGLILGTLIYYEPTFRLVSHYTPVPPGLSLSNRLRPSRKDVLHGRHGDYYFNRATDVLGVGGFGITYRGLDVKKNTYVVIKEPKLDPSKPLDSEQALKQLERESQSLEKLDFTGIIKWLDFVVQGGSYYVIEEYVQGRPLLSQGQSVVSQRGLGERDTIELTRKILYGLNYLHLHGVLHRDLNPGNVLVTPGGTVKLIDFGTSKKMTRLASTGFSAGSILAAGMDGYAPPEIASAGLVLSNSYDIYSVGGLMYLMLTGRHAPTAQALLSGADIGKDLSGRCSSNLIRIVQKAMEADARNRYQSAFEMLAAIDGLKGSFIVTDNAESYNLAGVQELTIIADEDYDPTLGQTHTGETQIMLKAKGKRNAQVGKVTFDQKVGQYSLISEPKTGFALLTRQAEKNNVTHYFLGPEAVFWLDEGNKDYRNGVFSYLQV